MSDERGARAHLERARAIALPEGEVGLVDDETRRGAELDELLAAPTTS